MNTYYVELNFSGSNTIDTGIAVSQGDYGKVQLSIACKKDGQFISDAESAEIIFQTEKGKVINGDLTGSGGLYGYVFQGNELQDPGKLVATVTLHYEDGQTSSESFLMAVRYNPLYDQNLQAGPYITQLEKLQAQAQGYVDYIGAIIEQLRQDIGETALTKADLQNDFAQSQSGIKALDAALGPQILQKSNIVNNLLATITGNVLDATQGKVLDEKITQLYSNFDVSSKTLTLSNSTLFSADNTASRIFKVGPRTRIAIIRAANFNAVSAGGTYQVGTLDEEDRPVAETCAVITRTDGNTNNMFVINLQTDGRVSIRPLTQCSAGVTCIGTISWPTSA